MSIHAIDVVSYEYPHLEILVRCGKGTYIRSLARDLGEKLGCAGYITSLRRLEVGCFHATEACALDLDADAARQRLLPLARAVHDLPTFTLPEAEAARLLHGGSAPVPKGWSGQANEGALLDTDGRLLAVVEIAKGQLRPGKVLVSVR